MTPSRATRRRVFTGQLSERAIFNHSAGRREGEGEGEEEGGEGQRKVAGPGNDSRTSADRPDGPLISTFTFSSQSLEVDS